MKSNIIHEKYGRDIHVNSNPKELGRSWKGFFPTCQVRVVRFYKKSCPALLLLLLLLLLLPLLGVVLLFAVIFAVCMLQWAAPDLNCKLQIAMGSAGPQRRASDRSGQGRASTGSSRAEWAAPDPERNGSAGPQPQSAQPEWAASAAKICQKRMSEDMSENTAEKDVRRYGRRWQKKCQ